MAATWRLGKLGRVARASISAAVSIVVILFLYGYLKPIGLDPLKILGFDMSSIFQIYGGSTTGSPFAALLPGGATGLILYQVLSRVGHSVSSVAAAATMPDPEDMMKRLNIPNMMGMMGGMGPMASVPANLPADITRSQFIVLRCYRQGMKNPGDVGRALSMDVGAIEGETSNLTTNGYLTKDRRLTTKGLEIIGA